MQLSLPTLKASSASPKPLPLPPRILSVRVWSATCQPPPNKVEIPSLEKCNLESESRDCQFTSTCKLQSDTIWSFLPKNRRQYSRTTSEAPRMTHADSKNRQKKKIDTFYSVRQRNQPKSNRTQPLRAVKRHLQAATLVASPEIDPFN